LGVKPRQADLGGFSRRHGKSAQLPGKSGLDDPAPPPRTLFSSEESTPDGHAVENQMIWVRYMQADHQNWGYCAGLSINGRDSPVGQALLGFVGKVVVRSANKTKTPVLGANSDYPRPFSDIA